MVCSSTSPLSPVTFVDYDPIFYTQQADLVADGHGFIAPYLLDPNGNGPHRPSAGHPPLLVVVLAVSVTLGARSSAGIDLSRADRRTHRPVARADRRRTGRRRGDRRLITALYPNLWLYDGLLMTEALAGVLIALALCRLPAPAVGGHVVAGRLGVIIGLAALTAR